MSADISDIFCLLQYCPFIPLIKHLVQNVTCRQHKKITSKSLTINHNNQHGKIKYQTIGRQSNCRSCCR